MFRVKSEKGTENLSTAERILEFALLAAIITSSGSTYWIRQESRRVSAWLNSLTLTSSNLDLLRRQLDYHSIAGLVVISILLFCYVALRRLRRKYWLSRRSLRQVKMLAHDILAGMDRGVITFNYEGIVTSINSAGIKLLGVDFDCVGASIDAISSREVPLVEIGKTVLRDRSPVCDRDTTIERGGHMSQLRMDAHLLHDSEGAAVGCVVHLRDVTERMLLEEQMRRLERFGSIEMLASGLHHEIKNPLTALSIHIQLLEEALSSGDSESRVEDFVGVLKTEVHRLNGVLENFRDFANLQKLALQTTDVLEVIENVRRLIQPQASQQCIKLSVVRPDTLLPLAQVDPDKFEQAVLNLVINAIEAMPDGGDLTINVSEPAGTLRVAIEDTGPGIPPEVRRNLFRPYFSTKQKGSGIGLALSAKIISQHQGSIEYRTGEHGTVFEITIPIEQVAEYP